MHKVEKVGPQEKAIESILDEMADMMKTSKGGRKLSVSEPEAVIPQFQLPMKLAQFRKYGVQYILQNSWLVALRALSRIKTLRSRRGRAEEYNANESTVSIMVQKNTLLRRRWREMKHAMNARATCRERALSSSQQRRKK